MSKDLCWNCGIPIKFVPAAIVLPKNDNLGSVGICGRYCTWNCAKRGLLNMKIKPWFSWLSIVALKAGCKLPIIASNTGECPSKQISKYQKRKIPLYVYEKQSYITTITSSEISDSEPEVFESIIQSSF